jgi:hypothetical protein
MFMQTSAVLREVCVFYGKARLRSIVVSISMSSDVALNRQSCLLEFADNFSHVRGTQIMLFCSWPSMLCLVNWGVYSMFRIRTGLRVFNTHVETLLGRSGNSPRIADLPE